MAGKQRLSVRVIPPLPIRLNYNATLVLDDSVRDVNTLEASFLKICLH